MNKSVSVKLYHGYGHTHDLVVYGHVFRFKAKVKQVYSDNLFVNVLHLLKLFVLKPYPFVKVRLHFNGQTVFGHTEYDGFFKIEWAAEAEVSAGWHRVKVEALNDKSEVMAAGEGLVYVPHITQYGFISDIDDTVIVSHSATIIRRLRELFIKNPRTRKTFADARKFYNLLAAANTDALQPNPFFYVSSSEWNLYDYLLETFRHNKLPEGAFLLNQIKRWGDLIKTGKTGHEGKLMRVMRILDAFPSQKFVLIGDNSQKDPTIYTSIAHKYPQKIEAIYIRNARPDKAMEAGVLLKEVEILHGIRTCLFNNNEEAMLHSRRIGLIE